MNKKAMKFILILIIFCTLSIFGCKKEKEPKTTISSESVTLFARDWDRPKEKEEKERESKIKRIVIGPSKGSEEPLPPTKVEEVEKEETKTVSLPPQTFEETALTERLQDKLLDAYEKSGEEPPNVKIYLSDMTYDEFIKYYKDLGYKVHTVAVPATEVIDPVLERRPEMADKIDYEEYENIIIHQVIVDEAGISAADKYIDPDTFEVVNKTFVTKMK